MLILIVKLKYCPHCGTQLTIGTAKFCHNCGKNLECNATKSTCLWKPGRGHISGDIGYKQRGCHRRT